MLCCPVDYTNMPHIIMQNNNVISINNTTQIDLQGQAASESDGLHSDIDLGAPGAIMAGQSRQAIEGMADEIQPRERNRKRALLLGLRHDLIDAGAQLEISAAQCLLLGQQRDRGAAARSVLHDRIG
jgi:hypothetical protein